MRTEYSPLREFLFWKNKATLVKTADLENDQVRRSIAIVSYDNYCSHHEDKPFHDGTMLSVVKFIRSVYEEKNKTKALDAIREGLAQLKNKLPPDQRAIIKLEEI